MQETFRQLLIGGAFEICQREAPALEAWTCLAFLATPVELARLYVTHDAELTGAIQLMARCDCDALGPFLEPRFSDAVEVWIDCAADAETDSRVLRAIRILGDRAEPIYRLEWARMQDSFENTASGSGS